jgi:radical SAM protein with 4Fe4S-binding SPASM domain
VECPHIPELSYGEFSKRLHEKVAGQRIPISGSLELTFRCNLRCVHCYAAHGHHGIPGKQELTYKEICGILDQIADQGCLWLLLTGGEPLVRSDFLDIYTYAKHKGLIFTLFTNGTLITPRIADYLAEWRPFVVEITLYGRTQETYERITGIPGSHARCMRGIELLLERDVPLRLKTMLMTLNKHELGGIKAYAESLGVDFRFDPKINAGLDGSKEPLAFRLSPEEAVQIDLADAKRLRLWQDFCDKIQDVPIERGHLYICGAGLNSFHIDPYGQLSLCLVSRVPSYNLRQGSFREGWREFLPQVRYQKPQGDYQCGQCELLPICGQCPGWAQLEHGDPEKPVEFLCQLAHLRAEAFGFGSGAESVASGRKGSADH